MVKCSDIIEHADRLLARDLNWRERLALRLHVAMCKQCGRVIEQYHMVVASLRQLDTPASDEEVATVMAGIDGASEESP